MLRRLSTISEVLNMRTLSSFITYLIFFSFFPNAKCRGHQAFQLQHAVYRQRASNTTAPRIQKRSTDLAKNVTFLLNSVLEDYDRHFRPEFNSGKPTVVYIDMFVRTMGPVSELTDTFEFNCYFRQTWTDKRLRFNGTKPNQQLSLSMTMLDRIWKPDTYFWNGARSYVHAVTNSNRLVRLFADGTILYSSRITVRGKCSMTMMRYPLDRQACRLLIGSYAYSSDKLVYVWKSMGTDKGVQMDYEAIADLPQFSVTGFQTFDARNITRDMPYSVLEARFYFDRHFGYFLMNFYVPCTLIVLMCWVMFWTNRESSGERLGMGATSVLTLVLIAIDSKKDSPKVDFPTALDVYIWICYTTLTICMVEFTVVHYYTKFNTGDPEIQAAERERMRQLIRSIPKRAILSSRHYNRPRTLGKRLISVSDDPFSRRDGGRHSMIQRTRRADRNTRKVLTPENSNPIEEQPNLEEFQHENIGWRLYYWMLSHGKKTDPFGLAENSISIVDRFSRIILPFLFILVVVLYYNFYVNTPHNFKFDDHYDH